MKFLFNSQYANIKLLGFIVVSWVSPNSTQTSAKCPQNSHQNKKKKKRKKLDKSYQARSPEELELSGTDQQELRNAAKVMLQSLTWRRPYEAGQPSTQVTGVFTDL